MNDKKKSSDLVTAAEAFDEELEGFSRLTDAARRAPLNSQKNLQRAARVFQDISEAEQRLAKAAQTLVGALASARERQQGQADSLETIAKEFNVRTELAGQLLSQYAELGQDAARLNQRMQEIAASQSGTPGLSMELTAGLREVAAGLGATADKAEALATKSREADFDDIARQVDSLRQQILAVREKFEALETDFAPN